MYDCECIDCGHEVTSDEHCNDLKCEKCGGQMRRAERPGPGQDKESRRSPAEENQEMTPTLTDAERNRWFSTGYLAHGIGAVNTEQHSLSDAAVIRRGEALGHGLWIDSAFCSDVATHLTELGTKGLKARFGHPDMCSAALGTFLGRWKSGHTDDDGVVRATLHLSSTAAESPKGDLRNYVEEMAAKEPDHFGTSIVFARDWDAEDQFTENNMAEEDETNNAGQPTGNKVRSFKSPDPENVKNLRHARLSELHAADLVDDPAATDGMFSGAGGAALASQVSEWLDTHPEVLTAFGTDPEMLTIVERYASELRPFVERYNANHPAAELATKKPATPAEPEAADERTDMDATAEKETVELKAEVKIEEPATPEGEVKLTDEQLLESWQKLTERLDAAEAERDEAQRKLTALEAGASAVSAEAAKENELTPWQKATHSSPNRKK